MDLRFLPQARKERGLLAEGMKNYKEIFDSTEKIEQHVKRAKGITQRMLGFGRRMNPGRTEILISSLADQAVEMLKTEAANRNIAIVRQYDAHVPVILSDPAQLEQIFINVIDNAIDAMGKNGTLTVSTQPWRNGVRVSFTDTVPGMWVPRPCASFWKKPSPISACAGIFTNRGP